MRSRRSKSYVALSPSSSSDADNRITSPSTQNDGTSASLESSFGSSSHGWISSLETPRTSTSISPASSSSSLSPSLKVSKKSSSSPLSIRSPPSTIADSNGSSPVSAFSSSPLIRVEPVIPRPRNYSAHQETAISFSEKAIQSGLNSSVQKAIKKKSVQKSEPSKAETETDKEHNNILHSLFNSDPSNKRCADCQIYLVGLKDCYLSFSHNQKEEETEESTTKNLRKTSKRSTHIPPFHPKHIEFAPPNTTASFIKNPSHIRKITPVFCVEFSVFVCPTCSLSHSSLDTRVTTVKSLPCSMTNSELSFVKNYTNAKSNSILEKHLPDNWNTKIKAKLRFSFKKEEREVFIRAKYEVLAFLYPVGPLSCPDIWDGIFKRKRTMTSLDPLRRSFSLSVAPPPPSKKEEKRSLSPVLPNTLVDYFCIAGPKCLLSETLSEDDWHNATLETSVLNSYSPHLNEEVKLPSHIDKFVFPDGCHPILSPTEPPSPQSFSIVLTEETGLRIYACCLKVYDETRTVYSPSSGKISAVVHLPKILMILSHYPFYSVFRTFLLQIYRISLSEAPLPLERYISNFCAEVPLPPQGIVEVRFGFLQNGWITFHRPPPNQLPLVDFSFRILFGCLSIQSVLTIFGCLLQEAKVCLCSKYYSLLTPIAESLRSLLFPMEWEGCYVPVMPYDMLEVLEAPMPFLVGIHGRYLDDVKAEWRPQGVVFVDIDQDVVHLGYEETEDGTVYGKGCPALIERGVLKLKKRCEEAGCGNVYIHGGAAKGRITYGNGIYMKNGMREAYAISEDWKNGKGNDGKGNDDSREDVLKKVDLAFWENEHLIPSGFMTEEGMLMQREKSREQERVRKKTSNLSPKKSKQKVNEEKKYQKQPDDFFDKKKEESNDFSANKIRSAFLQFFVSLLKNYSSFINPRRSDNNFQNDHPAFLKDKFLNDLKLAGLARDYLMSVISTQMFERFVEASIQDPNSSAVLFFNESIISKRNRSNKERLNKGFKKITLGSKSPNDFSFQTKTPTPFLQNEKWFVKDIYTPPSPSNWGLPDDGRTYCYPKFPTMWNTELFGKIRPLKQWLENETGSSAVTNTAQAVTSLAFLNHQARILSHLLEYSSQKQDEEHDNEGSDKSVDWAIHAIAYRNATLSTSEPPPPPTTQKLKHQASKRSLLKSDSTKNSVRQSPPTATKSAMSAAVLCSAQGLISTARRKQLMLLHQIILIQSLLRTFFSKKLYRKLCDEKFQDLVGKRLEKRQMAVTNIQRCCRGYRDRELVRERKKGIKTLHRAFLGFSIRRSFLLLRNRVVLVQTMQRGRRVRFLYKEVIYSIVLIQASFRGKQQRKEVSLFVKHRLELYRKQMFILWVAEWASFFRRGKFWMLIEEGGGDGMSIFLILAIYEVELIRLWRGLSLISKECGSSAENIFWTYSNLQERINFDPKLVTPINVNLEDFRHPCQRLSYQKILVYEKIKSFSDSQRESIFQMFDIPDSDKMKKQQVAEKMFGSAQHIRPSLKIFAEMLKSKEVTDQPKIPRSLRKRFKIGQKQLSIVRWNDRDENCVRETLEVRISADMSWVARGCLSGVRKFDSAISRKKRSDSLVRQRIADIIFAVDGRSATLRFFLDRTRFEI